MSEKLKAPYFRHDENAANDLKSLHLRSDLGIEGYGIYWFLVEQLSQAGGKIPMKMVPILSQAIGTTADKTMAVIKDYGLFGFDDDGFFSERLNKELENRGALSESGRQAGIASARKRAELAQSTGAVQRPLSDRSTPVQRPLKTRSTTVQRPFNLNRIEENRTEENRTVNQLSVGDLEARKTDFWKEVNDSGSRTYSKRLLVEFFDHWSEINPRHKKPRMRFEMQKTFQIANRLSVWAKRVTEYEPLLSDSEKTIAEKKHAFAVSLEAYLEKYSREQLNSFYQYWSQPENKKDSQRLRFELEPAWELGARLMKWAENNPKKA